MPNDSVLAAVRHCVQTVGDSFSGMFLCGQVTEINFLSLRAESH